jgi:hypothetical protein
MITAWFENTSKLFIHGGPEPVVKPRAENGERIHGGSVMGSGIT